MVETLTALGLMSGTSADGIDVALLETDGQDVVTAGASQTVPYAAGIRRKIGQAAAEAASLDHRDARPGVLKDLELDLTTHHADAVAEFLARIGQPRDSIDIVGFHGQTVLHRPERGLTVQLGRGDDLARLLGLPVAWDMRAADVAAGGQGAPLAPVFHRALAARTPQRPVAILNIGGVANVTWIGCDGDLMAFDTGPGNALIDDWMTKTTGAPHDAYGTTAQAGCVQQSVVDFFLNHSFFSQPPPKSLDRNAFFWDLIDGMSTHDGAATLTAMTVGAVAAARRHMPQAPEVWLVSGGGRHNRAIMAGLADALAPAQIQPIETVGWNGDAIEAQAWAYLAVRSLKGLPITFPGTTGIALPATGGVISDC